MKVYARNTPDDLPEQSYNSYGTDFKIDDPRYSFSRRLGSLLAPQWLTKEVNVFIHGLIKWELARAHGKDEEHDLGSTTLPLSLLEWRRVANGLADLWNWWGEGVHLRIQPKYLGKRISGWVEPYANDLVHWAMPQDLPKGEVPTAPRTISIDSHLGDGLFKLCTLVHHYLAIPPGNIGKWESFDNSESDLRSAVRRYQSLDKLNGAWVVRFAPSGPNGQYFMNYISRINAAGWHPDFVFPVGSFLRSIDLRDVYLPVIAFARCDLEGVCLEGTRIEGSMFAGSNLKLCNWRNSMCIGVDFDGCEMHNSITEGMHVSKCSFEKTTPNKVVSKIQK